MLRVFVFPLSLPFGHQPGRLWSITPCKCLVKNNLKKLIDAFLLGNKFLTAPHHWLKRILVWTVKCLLQTSSSSSDDSFWLLSSSFSLWINKLESFLPSDSHSQPPHVKNKSSISFPYQSLQICFLLHLMLKNPPLHLLNHETRKEKKAAIKKIQKTAVKLPKSSCQIRTNQFNQTLIHNRFCRQLFYPL